MPYRICLISLGCAKNQVNSEQMLYLLNQAGHEVVGEVDGCDVAIVNTCGFIDSAKSEAIDQILQLAEVKKAGGLKKILVTGCLSQRYEKDILESLPEVDGMLGTGSFGQICAAVEDVMHDGRPLYFGDKSGPIEEIGRVVTTGPGWAYLRIAEGCDNWCAFCAIPAIRGRYRSRTLDAIVQEARELADLGVKELIVIAQDITRWGMDLYGKPSLALLLRELAKIDGIRWIRLHYLYPEEITPELIDTIAQEPKILKYIDLPIQHCNDAILKAMRRRNTRAELEALFDKLRAGSQGTTSAVNPEEFRAEMEPVLAAGLDVLYVGFSSGLSTTYQSGCIAADDLREKYPERKILTVDSLCASLGQGLYVYLGALQQQAGKSIEEVRDYLEDIKLHLCHWFTVDDLMYLKRGGRISATTAVLGTVMQIKPVMHMDNDGHLANVTKARGRKGSLIALAEKALTTSTDLPSQTMFICHGDCYDDAKFVADYIRERSKVQDIIINYVGPVIGSHTGPGVVSVFFLGTER